MYRCVGLLQTHVSISHVGQATNVLWNLMKGSAVMIWYMVMGSAGLTHVLWCLLKGSAGIYMWLVVYGDGQCWNLHVASGI